MLENVNYEQRSARIFGLNHSGEWGGAENVITVDQIISTLFHFECERKKALLPDLLINHI